MIIWVLPLPAPLTGKTVYVQWIVQAHGRIFNIPRCYQLVSDYIEMVLYSPLNIHIDQVVPVISQIPVFYVLNLLINNSRTNNEHYGNSKLNDHQPLS